MATILQFRQPETGSDAPENPPMPDVRSNGRSAEIIIFPGVRIERHKSSENRGVRKPAKRACRSKSREAL